MPFPVSRVIEIKDNPRHFKGFLSAIDPFAANFRRGIKGEMELPATATPPEKPAEIIPFPNPTPPPPSDPPSDPPAAKIVATAPISESSVQAQRELEEVNRKLRETEIRASQLEDENKRLKTIPANPIDEAAKKQKKSFLSGWRPIID